MVQRHRGARCRNVRLRFLSGDGADHQRVSPTIPMSCCAGAIGGCSSPGRSTRVRERLARLTPVQWAALQDLFASAMDRLTVQPYTADNHSLEYWNAGSVLSPSFVPPGSTILLSANLRLS